MNCPTCGVVLDPQRVAQTGACQNCNTPVPQSFFSGSQQQMPMSGPPQGGYSGSQPQVGYAQPTQMPPGFSGPSPMMAPGTGGYVMQQPMMPVQGGVVLVQAPKNSGKAVASLVLGILAAIFGCIGFFVIRGTKAVATVVNGVTAAAGTTTSVGTGTLIFLTVGFLILPILGVIFGHISLKDIAASGGQLGGRGMGIAGLACGYAGGAAALLGLLLPV